MLPFHRAASQRGIGGAHVSSYEAVLDLVDRIYAAAETPELWPDALEGIAEATGSAASLLYRNMDAREGASTTPSALPLTPRTPTSSTSTRSIPGGTVPAPPRW